MLPLADVNPTRRRPVMTLLLVGLCAAVWLGWQQEPQRAAVDDLIFNLEHAAIPCELTRGRALTTQEVTAAYGLQGGDDEACGVGRQDAPSAVDGKWVWLAAITSMFLHGGLAHIAGNLLFLWVFGNNIEDHLGHTRFLLFYLVGGLAALGAHVALNPDSVVPVVGASGAIAAVMGAYLVWFPRAPVRTLLFVGLPLLVTVQARWLLSIWFVIQFFTSPNAGVAWAAHVGGFVFGAVIGALVRLTRMARRRLWTRDYASIDAGWDTTGGVGPVHERRRWPNRP